MALTLVILAAGMGSRYGGLKQIDPIGAAGEIICDYSMFDAARAGFDRFVFVIRPEIEEEFRDTIGHRVEREYSCAYVRQEITTGLPDGFRPPPGRRKPLGTAHAALICAGTVKGPFAVINADDFYGSDAFRRLAAYLKSCPPDGADYAMVAYALNKTLSENGPVARGICRVSPDGLLEGIEERAAIESDAGNAYWRDAGGVRQGLAADTPVSMNFWGFTPSIFPRLAVRFADFLESLAQRPDDEFFLPSAVGGMLREGSCRVRVLHSADQWFGVTYPADKPDVRKQVRALVAAGIYPAPLWG